MSILSRLKPHKMVIVLALALVLAGAFALPVQATTLDFTLGLLPGGTVSFAGGLSPLIGTGIDVSFVVDKDTANVPIPVTNGVLSFTTGPLTGFSPTEWDFGGGASSSIKITGAVPAAGITDPSTVLLSGTFDLAKVIYLANSLFSFQYRRSGLPGHQRPCCCSNTSTYRPVHHLSVPLISLSIPRWVRFPLRVLQASPWAVATCSTSPSPCLPPCCCWAPAWWG